MPKPLCKTGTVVSERCRSHGPEDLQAQPWNSVDCILCASLLSMPPAMHLEVHAKVTATVLFLRACSALRFSEAMSNVGCKQDNMEVPVPPGYNLQHCAKRLLQHVRYTRRRMPSGVRRVWRAFRSTHRTGRLCNSVCATACVRSCSAARNSCNCTCSPQSTIY